MCDLSFRNVSFTNGSALAFGLDVKNEHVISVNFSVDEYVILSASKQNCVKAWRGIPHSDYNLCPGTHYYQLKYPTLYNQQKEFKVYFF